VITGNSKCPALGFYFFCSLALILVVSNKVDDLVSWFVDFQGNGRGLP